MSATGELRAWRDHARAAPWEGYSREDRRGWFLVGDGASFDVTDLAGPRLLHDEDADAPWGLAFDVIAVLEALDRRAAATLTVAWGEDDPSAV